MHLRLRTTRIRGNRVRPFAVPRLFWEGGWFRGRYFDFLCFRYSKPASRGCLEVRCAQELPGKITGSFTVKRISVH